MVFPQKLNHLRMFKKYLSPAIFINLLINTLFPICIYAQNHEFDKAIIRNEDIIHGVKQQINISDPEEVFRYVFHSLRDEITIYPSENYYYYIFNINGRTFWSSFCLSADSRDDGVLSFGYIEKSNFFTGDDSRAAGGSKDFTPKDGMVIKKIDPFKYSVSYNRKTILFHLNKLNLKLPEHAQFMEDEHLIGPNFDESGLQFYLVFNKKTDHFYWILNEEEYVPENFDPDSCNILFSRRTGFAFFDDTLHSRKILIGADAHNVLKNNWYDGPFDQLPDNHVKTGEIEIQKYIEAAYPADSGRIDIYGNFLDQKGVRVAIAPYYAYYSKQELIDYVRECISEEKDLSRLFTCLTQQIFYLE
jgi:hypothetical protein